MSDDIRYCTTRDGWRIAYAVSGSGPPLLYTPGGLHGWISHRAIPSQGRWLETLERHFTIVRYDMRGSGFSQRGAEDFATETFALDAEAVAAQIDAPEFALFGNQGGLYSGLAFARDHPERVSSVILWPPQPASYSNAPHTRGMARLLDDDWETFTENYAHIAYGWRHSDEAHQYAQVLREAVSQHDFRASLRWFTDHPEPWTAEEWITRTAGAIRCPVLVVSYAGIIKQPQVANLAAAFPDARTRVIEGEDSSSPAFADQAALAQMIADFVSEASGVAPPPPPAASAETLSPREREVLTLLARGRSNRDIAQDLVLSERTVARHIANIYVKIGAHGRADATAFALRSGLG